MPLTPFARMRRDYLKEKHPARYQALTQAGQLMQECEQAATQTKERFGILVEQGLDAHEARAQALQEIVHREEAAQDGQPEPWEKEMADEQAAALAEKFLSET